MPAGGRPSKGGSEATVRVAKADLVPTDANLLAGLRQTGRRWRRPARRSASEVNARPHRVTRRPRWRCWPRNATVCTACPSIRGPRRSGRPARSAAAADGAVGVVPVFGADRLAGETVWVRRRGEEVIITHVGADGPVEVARHQVTTPGNPRVDDAHFPPAPEGPLNRTPRARTAAEAEFLAIGDGAALWLKEAGAAGGARVRAKMADAVALAKLQGSRRSTGRSATPPLRPLRRRRPGFDPRSSGQRGHRQRRASRRARTTAWPGHRRLEGVRQRGGERR